MTEDPARRPEADDDDDKSLVDKVKKKVEDVLDAPRGAGDPGKTNPVTGQLRDP